MTMTLTKPVLEVAAPTVRTALEGMPDYDAGDYTVGDRIKFRHGWGKVRPGDEGSVIRVDEGDIYPLIVWADKWGPQTSVEAVARMGLPTCAGDLNHV